MSHHTEKEISRVKELFLKLKKAHVWIQKHQDKPAEIEGLIQRSEPIFKELEVLGVDRDFSQALLIFGPLITNSIVQEGLRNG